MLAATTPIVVRVASGVSPVVTAFIALGSALAGSLAGAGGTYLAQRSLQRRAEEARAAARRKAKIYAPLRMALRDLREWVSTEDALNEHRPVEQVRSTTWDRDTPQANHFFLWSDMMDDGRALSASSSVRDAMTTLSSAIDHWNMTVRSASAALQVVGPDVALSVTGKPSNWQSFDATLGPLVSGEAPSAFQVGLVAMQDDRALAQEWAAEIGRRMASDPRVVSAVEMVTSERDRLMAAIDAAEETVTASIDRISEKYEHERREE